VQGWWRGCLVNPGNQGNMKIHSITAILTFKKL